MKEDTESTETTSRRAFTKAAVIAAIAAPIAAFIASCTKQPRQAAEPTPAASPAPTEHPLDGDGSPITVGGGGGIGDRKADEMYQSCVFSEADYPEPQGDPGLKQFRHPGWRMQTLRLSTKNGIQDLSDLLPQIGNPYVILKFKGGGPKEEVKINGSDFGIDMDTTVYKKNPAGTIHTNPNAASYIYQVIFYDGKNLHNYGEFKKDDNCAVCTDHVEKSKKCS